VHKQGRQDDHEQQATPRNPFAVGFNELTDEYVCRIDLDDGRVTLTVNWDGKWMRPIWMDSEQDGGELVSGVGEDYTEAMQDLVSQGVPIFYRPNGRRDARPRELPPTGVVRDDMFVYVPAYRRGRRHSRTRRTGHRRRRNARGPPDDGDDEPPLHPLARPCRAFRRARACARAPPGLSPAVLTPWASGCPRTQRRPLAAGVTRDNQELN